MYRFRADADVLPAWKNSPIKTIPTELRRISVQSQKPQTHKQPRVLQSSSATTQHDASKILKDVSSMFDDDGDQLESVVPNDISIQQSRDEDAMRAMFASPTPSVNNSFANDGAKPESVYYWDQVENFDDDDIVQEENSFPQEARILNSHETETEGTMDSHQNLSSVLREASRHELQYGREKSQPIDLSQELTKNSFLLEHIQFLSDFDREMTGHIDTAHSTQSNHSTHKTLIQDKTDYERELITKLDHYLQLPEESLHAMVMRQHQEIVQLGMFSAE